ncbi:hypothetical protein [Streptomyces alfalfae]|uniref:hypothetical protein n=1 Tax=Streptomyces alfalfae TaxID=1642299 RepID=UPI002811AF82|nr:hypothetical protein [Streptomyces alfalfae]
MQPAALEALEAWESAFTDQQDAAVTAATTAFPPLELMRYPTGCCDLRMQWETTGLGAGTVCIDEGGRGTVEFRDMPHAVVGEAVDALMGAGWFEDAPDGIAAAGPGTYYWCDDEHGSEWEIKIIGDGRLEMTMDAMRVPDVLGVLDSLHTALTST